MEVVISIHMMQHSGALIRRMPSQNFPISMETKSSVCYFTFHLRGGGGEGEGPEGPLGPPGPRGPRGPRGCASAVSGTSKRLMAKGTTLGIESFMACSSRNGLGIVNRICSLCCFGTFRNCEPKNRSTASQTQILVWTAIHVNFPAR